MHVFFMGYPGAMGGANTECWHTAKVWRKAGIEVTFIPTWNSDPATEARLAAIGCKTLHVGNADSLVNVRGLAGSIVVGMCNANYHRAMGVLRRLGCKLVFSNCMTFCFAEEMQAYRRHGLPHAMHFQSDFQARELARILAPFGYDASTGHVIRGAFAFDEIPYAPRTHETNTEFVIGRLARTDTDKWSSNHWNILARVPYKHRRGLAMGWHRHLDKKCGPKPSWAETFAPQQIPVPDFLGRCHAMLGLNGGARENWPRIGLEAMAAGVPIVAQNEWGWKEMIVDGETGFLTNSDEETVFRLAQLAYDEDLRRKIAADASDYLAELADPQRIAAQWTELFTDRKSVV